MSLISICRSVLAETGWPVLTSIASNSDATAVQIFEIANTELQALSEIFNWPQLEVEYAFSTVAAQAVYLWPLDFRVMAQQSLFDASEYYQMKGSCGIQDWHYRKEGLLGNLSRKAFRLQYPLNTAGIEITPTPVGVENLVGTYYTKYFAYDPIALQGRELYTLDTDVSLIPERYVKLGVKWRFRRAKGLDYSAEYAEYLTTIKQQYSAYLGQAVINVGGRRWGEDWPLTGGYVPPNGFGV